MKLGIIGLPNVGKSTLFNAITRSGAEATNYPFSTKVANVGVVTVPDSRLKVLHEMYKSKKTTYTAIEFCDIAGLVRGASKGEGLGNKFLADIRQVSALVHVVRCFDDDNVFHVDGRIDPLSDMETVNLELVISDLDILERRLERTRKALKGSRELQWEAECLGKIIAWLEEGKPLRTMELTTEESNFVRTLEMLSMKPVIYVANVPEDHAGDDGEGSAYVDAVRAFAAVEGSDVVVICAKLEAELSQLEDEERAMFLEELGIGSTGLDKLIRASYHLLDLISFLTAGEPEVRAWTIHRGTKAPGAAGKIHSDIERGFIRAETITYDHLVECNGNMAAAREKGWLRSEGKEYEVKDGDVIHFLFNV